MLSSPYLPHVIYAIALTSISINLVSKRKYVEDERSRMQAQISILESIKQQLQSDKPLSTDELERLKRLARPAPVVGAAAAAQKAEEVTWGTIFSGQRPVVTDTEMSKWDAQDLETIRKEMSK